MGASKTTSSTPGTIGQIPAFRIFVSIVALTAVAGLTVRYAFYPQNRETLEFFVLTLGVAGGLLGAYYVWIGLRDNYAQKEAERQDRKLRMALRYVERANDPALADVRRKWRDVIRECRENKADICELMKDMEKRTATADITNLLEEVAYATRAEIADAETIKQHIAGQVLNYYQVLRPWVDLRRKEAGRPKILEHLEWLYDQYKLP
jgi:hypothetical protein